MAQHRVCISFDFDAISGFISRGLISPTPISRGEFGPVAVPRILAMLRKYDVPSTWFIPGHTLQTYPDECRQVFDAGHEIGHHGWTHTPPNDMSREEEEEGILRGNEQIRKLTGRNARGYRSPSWDLSPHSVELMLKHGFRYESSMMGNDYLPYRVRQGDVIELQKPAKYGAMTPLIEMPVSWTLDDYPHFEFLRTKTYVLPGLMNANSVLDNWVNDFVYMQQYIDWGILTYTFHPFVIGRGHRMLVLEKLLKVLSESGVQFCTMEDAADAYDVRFPFFRRSKMMDTFTSRDGLKLAYQVDDFTDPWRKPDTLLLLHAAMGNSQRWFQWVSRLARRYRVVRLDLRGHGMSEMPGPESDFSLAQLVGDAVEVLDLVGATQAHIVGNSAGGYISQQLALRHPDRVSTLALFGSTPGLKHSHAASWVPKIKEMGLKQFLASTIDERFDEKADPDLVKWFIEQAGSNDPAFIARFVLHMCTHDFMEELPAIKAPTLIVAAGKERIGHASAYEEMRRRIDGAELRYYDTAAHNICDGYATQCVDDLLDFLQRRG